MGRDIFASSRFFVGEVPLAIGYYKPTVGPDNYSIGNPGYFWHYHACNRKKGHIFIFFIEVYYVTFGTEKERLF